MSVLVSIRDLMNLRLLSAVYFALSLAVCGVFFPDGAIAMIIATVAAGGVVFALIGSERDTEDLIKIFLLALILRIAASAVIHFLKIEDFFAGDWHAYDFFGEQLANYWTGVGPYTDLLNWRVFSFRGTMWGICIFVG